MSSVETSGLWADSHNHIKGSQKILRDIVGVLMRFVNIEIKLVQRTYLDELCSVVCGVCQTVLKAHQIKACHCTQ